MHEAALHGRSVPSASTTTRAASSSEDTEIHATDVASSSTSDDTWTKRDPSAVANAPSVDERSPMTQVGDAPLSRSRSRDTIARWGLPATSAGRPAADATAATIDPPPGNSPWGAGYEGSSLVAMNLDPALMWRAMHDSPAYPNERCMPTTTASNDGRSDPDSASSIRTASHPRTASASSTPCSPPTSTESPGRSSDAAASDEVSNRPDVSIPAR